MDKLKQQLPGFAVGAAVGFLLAKILSRSSSKDSGKKVVPASDDDDSKKQKKKKQLFILISGKRAGGKDYCAKKLSQAALALDPPIGMSRVAMGDWSKRLYAEENKIDFDRLMNDREFKEQHRAGITRLYEEKISQDRGFFHKKALAACNEFGTQVILITDARVPFDVAFFEQNADCITLRIHADDETRKLRGWDGPNDKDNHDTETGLDNHKFDLFVDTSNNDAEKLKRFIDECALPEIKKRLQKK